VSTTISQSELTEWMRWLQEAGVKDLAVPLPASPGTITESHNMEDESDALSIASSLDHVRELLGDCTRCKLHLDRNTIVFGDGSPEADLFFVGEGPGAEEDKQGIPFVGRAGKKLTEMIRAIGYGREDVYIANVVKCRPPGNRDPQPDETATCSPFLFAQIEAIKPKVIITLGSPATKLLLETKTGITRLRGKWHDFRGIPVMPTFHPAYLLRRYTHENRAMVYGDLKAARSRIDQDS